MAAPPQPTAVGDVTGLCILVQFPDVPGTITRQQVDNFCNQAGYTGFGNNGSVRDYFLEISEGKLRYRNVVTAYYTAQQNRAYYTNPAIPFGSRARELITEALTNLRTNGFDFSQLSADSGGFVYALNVFYAGSASTRGARGCGPTSGSCRRTSSRRRRGRSATTRSRTWAPSSRCARSATRTGTWSVTSPTSTTTAANPTASATTA